MSVPSRTRGARLANYHRAKNLRDQGFLVREIAAAMGLSPGYISGLLNDPDGSIDKARKLSYRGTCAECGRPTDGSNGREKAPLLCHSCAPQRRKVWTRERVLDAILTWTERHGSRPKANEWIGTHSDPDGYLYPSRNSVYRAGQDSTSPFESWADAIEAAGFPRPHPGSWAYEEPEVATMAGKATRDYLVLEHDASLNPHYRALAIVEAETTQQACELVAEGSGKFAAVPVNSLQEYNLRTQLVASRASRDNQEESPT